MQQWTVSRALALVVLVHTTASAGFAASAATPDRSLNTAHGLLNRGLYTEAAAEYRIAIAGFDDSEDRTRELEALYGLGIALLRSGETEAAIEALAEVGGTPNAPYQADAASLHADLLRSTAQFSEAADVAERFLDTFPDHAARLPIIAAAVECRQRTGQHRRALKLFRDHRDELRLAPEYHERAGLFAAIAATERNTETAIELFGWLSQDASDGDIREQAAWRLGSTLLANDQPSDAVKVLREAMENAGAATRNHVALTYGSALRMSGDPDSAIAVLRELREHDATFQPGECAFELGIAQLEADRGRAAAETLEEAITLLDEEPAIAARYWRARALLSAEEFENAFDELSDLIEHHEDSIPIEAGYDLAVALDRAGRSDDAASAYHRFRDAQPEHASASDALYAEAALALQADECDRAGTLAARFARENRQHPLAPEANFIVGEAAYRMDRFNSAASAFAKAIETSSDDDLTTRAEYRLGMALHRSGNAEAARTHLLTATSTDRFPAALKALGDIEFESENWDAATKNLKRYLDTKPTDAGASADATMRLALAYTRLEKNEQAAATFARVLVAHPESIHEDHARFELGQTLLLLGRTDKAEPLLLEAAQDEDSRFASHALRWLASIATQRGDAEKAAELLGRASNAGLDDAGTLEYAAALIASQSPAEAAQLLNGRRDTASRAWRVIALASAGEHEAAVRIFARLDLDDVEPALARSARYHAARASQEIGDTDAAIALYRSVMSDDTDPQASLFAKVELGLLLASREGEGGEAEKLLTSALDYDSLDPALCAAALYQLAGLASARADHKRVIELLDPSSRRCEFGDLEPHAELLLGIAFAETSRPGRAAERFVIAVQGFEGTAELAGALLRLGEAQGAAQRWADSATTLGRHAKEFPDDPLWFRARFGIGWAIEQGGTPQGAIEHYREVVEKHEGATAARAQFQIGECLFSLGQHEEAVRELLRVDILYAEPEWSAAALYEAGRCFEAMSKIGEARAQYRDVTERFTESAWATAARERLDSLTVTEGGRRGAAGGSLR